MFSRRAIRTKAVQYLYAFFMQRQGQSLAGDEEKAFTCLETSFSREIANLNAVHIQLMHLLLGWATLDETSEKEAFIPHPRHLRTLPWLQQLYKQDIFVALTKKHPSHWPQELVQLWYYEDIQQHPLLLAYKKAPAMGKKAAHAFIKTFIAEVLLPHAGVQIYLETQYISWDTSSEVFYAFFMQTIKKLEQGMDASFALFTLAPVASEESFYRKLVTMVARKDVICEGFIAKQIDNWAMERVFFLDKILLKLGMIEKALFPEIPDSVVINEYIEIAKQYSTPKSYQFVNGLLDGMLQKDILAALA